MNLRTLSATAVAGAALATFAVAPALAASGHPGKVTLCHVENGKAHTLHLPVAAAHGHKHHADDYLGACKPKPTPTPTPEPEPTTEPTSEPTTVPTTEPTTEPTVEPSTEPNTSPTTEPTQEPTTAPSVSPTTEPTVTPTREPITQPTVEPTTTLPAFPSAPMFPPVSLDWRPVDHDPAIGCDYEQWDEVTFGEPLSTIGASCREIGTPASVTAAPSDDVLANTGGTNAAWGIAGVLALAAGAGLIVARLVRAGDN